MTKNEIIEKLEALLQQEGNEQLSTEVEQLENDFEQVSHELEQAQREAFVAEGGDADDFEAPADADDDRFKELIEKYNEQAAKEEAKQAEDQNANLVAKQQIIEELKTLIASVVTGDKLAGNFDKFNELKERWKNLGAVPARAYKQLQSDYSHQLDMFFYNIDIYRALQTHDLNKNLEAKKALVAQVQELVNETSIKKMDDTVKAYQAEWSEIGPVKEEDWKDLRNDFWQAVNAIYDKIQAHFDQIREQQKKNLEAKEELVKQIQHINQEDLRTHKAWTGKTEAVLQAQQDWRKIGFGPREQNNAIWKEFRSACNEFFKKKKEHYAEQKEAYKEAREAKEALVVKADALKESTDWKETTNALIALQNEWKDSGAASHKDEQRLWKQFREACDHFFNAKKEFYATMDDRHAENLKQKEELLKEIEAFNTSGDNKLDLAALKELATRWRAIGHIPKKNIEAINNAYTKAMDENYGKLKMERKERSLARFNNKVESMEKADNSDRMLEREYRQVSDKVKELKDSIDQYENNLGFFGHSKGAEALKQDMMKKLEGAKEELKLWEEKLKMLPKPAFNPGNRRPQGGGNRGKGKGGFKGRR